MSESKSVKDEADDSFKSSLYGLKYALPIILVFTCIYGYMFLEFEQIPGPIYGGDYYFHYGIVKHIYNGNAPWTCPQVQGEYAFYPWLMHYSVAVFGWITGDLLKSFILYFPVAVVFVNGALIYLLGKALYREERFALLLTLAWMGMRLTVGYIPAHFTPNITLPLFLLATFYAYRTSDSKWILASGVSFGLFALSHASALPAGIAFLFFLIIHKSIEGHFKAGFDPESGKFDFHRDDFGVIKESLTGSLKLYTPIILVGILISMLYWSPVIGVYHFDPKNPWNDFTQPDYTVYGASIASEILTRYLFYIQGLSNGYLYMFLLSLLTSIGIISAFRNNDGNGKFIALGVIAGYVAYFHYIITIPLMGTHYAPVRMETFLLGPLAFLAAIYGIYSLSGLLRTDNGKNILIAVAFILFIILANDHIVRAYNNQWTQVGRMPANAGMNEIAEWVDENTDKNAVFLSHEELSFALNGLTGRKVLIYRRTHFNPYVELNERIADAGVMLYGNDSKKTLELLRKYDVDYVYWDINYVANAQFALKEPSLTWPKYKEYLELYGVRSQAMNTYIDPAYKIENKKYDVIAIIPSKDDPFQPWSDEFNKHIKVVKEVTGQTNDGQTIPIYRIFEIDYESFNEA